MFINVVDLAKTRPTKVAGSLRVPSAIWPFLRFYAAGTWNVPATLTAQFALERVNQIFFAAEEFALVAIVCVVPNGSDFALF